MQLQCSAFDDNAPIPDDHCFCVPSSEGHVSMGDNRNPGLSWSGAPSTTRSLVLICVDPDVPSRPDDVNQEGRTVSADLPRCDFYHWVMVDIDPAISEIAEGSCADGITAGGKRNPPGPAGARQGINDYTNWFAGDPDMGGNYFGYDGPCPPWNDERMHHYRFVLYATDLQRCPVEGPFTGQQVMEALAGHILAEASVTGLYSLNPAVRSW